MKIRNLISCALCGLTLFACSPSGGGKDREMDRFITDLMDRMTLREKLGQLNLPSGGDLVTGSVINGELSDMIRKQEIGGFFNVKGIQKINVLQHLAVEESRLKIPLLVGADVIHGYETIFQSHWHCPVVGIRWPSNVWHASPPLRPAQTVLTGHSARWSIFVVMPVGDVSQKGTEKILTWVL